MGTVLVDASRDCLVDASRDCLVGALVAALVAASIVASFAVVVDELALEMGRMVVRPQVEDVAENPVHRLR
jgi:hypothetical protein